MDEGCSMELDNAVERRQLRTIPSVDSAMIATPPNANEHLPEPDVVEGDRQDPMQRVEVKSPVRPRTRLERLTEMHTPQRPNWAMADASTASISHLHSTTKAVKRLRRVPNTLLRVPPAVTSFSPSRPSEPIQPTEPLQKRSVWTDSAHMAARSTWALAEDPTPRQGTPQAPTKEEQQTSFAQQSTTILGHGNVHPSRLGQISYHHQPTRPVPVTRGPIDSGWGQRRRHGIAKPTPLPSYEPQTQAEIDSPLGLRSDNENGIKSNFAQWSTRMPGQLRKVASSPDSYQQSVMFANPTQLHETHEQYAREEHLYEQQTVDKRTLNAEMQLNQLNLNLSSISLHQQSRAMLEKVSPDSHGTINRAPAIGLQGEYPQGHQSQSGIRTMHSAPDLMQRPNPIPNSELASTFLQVHRTRPMEASEYAGVIPNHQTTLNHSIPKGIGQVVNPTTATRILRRVPRFSVVNAADMQHRPEYDRIPGAEPAQSTVEHAFAMEFFALQLQAAEDIEIPDSPSEFQYDGIDSLNGQTFPPHQADYH